MPKELLLSFQGTKYASTVFFGCAIFEMRPQTTHQQPPSQSPKDRQSRPHGTQSQRTPKDRSDAADTQTLNIYKGRISPLSTKFTPLAKPHLRKGDRRHPTNRPRARCPQAGRADRTEPSSRGSRRTEAPSLNRFHYLIYK